MTINYGGKRAGLNYREAGDESACVDCEHRNKLMCQVMDGSIHFDMKCDAWNDSAKENTWYVFVHQFKETVCVLVKEEKTTVGRGEFPLPVDIDKEVIGILDEVSKIIGCPDFVTNIAPRKFKPVAFKSWLDYRCIQYTELDAEIDKMEFKVDGDMTPLDVLSLLIDTVWCSDNEGKDNGKQ